MNIQIMRARQKLADILVKHFVYHLKSELEKSDTLLNFITLEGISFKDLTNQMIEDVYKEFPQTKDQADPDYNFFKKWHESRSDEGVKPYNETTFKMYNQLYFSRILDIRDNSVESVASLKAKVERVLGVGKSYGRDFDFGLFFSVENSMKENVREMLVDECKEDYKDLWIIFYKQSEFYTGLGYNYYQSLLANALKRSDELLLSIFPKNIAEELKQKGKSEPVFIKQASVLFTDFTGFTRISEKLAPSVLIQELDYCFSNFDLITEKYNLEKIKTIGDAYLCVGGAPYPNETHAVDACLAAIDFLNFIKERKSEKEKSSIEYWDIKIGIHVGPIVAGVIGEKKLAYDVWGDTVNTASRMESMCEPNKINVSKEVYELTKDIFTFEYRGKFTPKNKSEVDMYFLTGIK
ncbi:MAG TPA: adenylate/guanylate cyclase domain-containing protein [Leptospiraceae bacterium]|nr:adenylate/guanylate cyclase domain-containing protein [Leptospiraceae bacterium]HMW04481.1 adenylate/guanylate cyclase domain-containing protein [Leptospiraceae bacterium]HMX31139.1 adenylate/guanylate cyclase domain-containing protein [Leptospiraceae bacterium]HMY30667.1 adenylate/guanylate cyclase domain-containing protein [Leptospiraceae bacterium]HMZ63264.1 adenylate/guanylate cyclase domain-containing protein [Leptospiraceae bacterium]